MVKMESKPISILEIINLIGLFILLFGMFYVVSSLEREKEGYQFNYRCITWDTQSKICNYIDERQGICYYACQSNDSITFEDLPNVCASSQLTCFEYARTQKLIK